MIGLADYFDNHTAQIEHDPSYAPRRFADFENCEIEFRVQAYEKTGNTLFQLKIMRSVWGGIEAEASIGDCRAYANELREYVKALQAAWFKKSCPGRTPSELDDAMRRDPVQPRL